MSSGSTRCGWQPAASRSPGGVLEAIVGGVPSRGERIRPEILPRDDGTWLVDGTVDIKAIEEILSTLRFGSEEDRNYQILANFVLEQLGRIPEEGEMFEAHGWHLEIVDMDRPRIDKVLLRAVKWAGLG